MATIQRRFLVINYWVGPPTHGILVGPVLVSTSDLWHFHLWDELEEATLDPCDYQIINVFPNGTSYDEAQAHFAEQYTEGDRQAIAELAAETPAGDLEGRCPSKAFFGPKRPMQPTREMPFARAYRHLSPERRR
jgi:hypothetical protein